MPNDPDRLFTMIWLQALPIQDGNNDSRHLTPSEVMNSVKVVLPGYKLGRVSLCADGSAAFDLPSEEVCNAPPPSEEDFSLSLCEHQHEHD